MNYRTVLSALGVLLMLGSAMLIVPLAVALACDDRGGAVEDMEAIAFLVPMLLSLAVGRWMYRRWRRESAEFGPREGFAVVAFAWVGFTLVGALPYRISGQCPSLADAVFETISGFATTGASVIADVEAMPSGLLFWRSFTHWIGGMGIIVLSLAVLPALGVGGYRLFNLEMSGVIRERFRPRIADTAKILWEVYVLLTALQVLLLVLGGMSLFDAVCNTFGTIATGGFSVRNAGIADHHSPWAEWVIVVFMFLGGTNFALHYALLHGQWRKLVGDTELWAYAGILLTATSALALLSWASGPSLGGVENTVRTSAFQAVSIMTTTGFATADFALWHPGARVILMLLMFVGGCTGSTAGSGKVIRYVLLWKLGVRELRQLLSPHAVIPVKLGGVAVEREVLTNVLVFFVLFVATFAAGTLFLALLGVDLESAASGTIACLGGVGPGLNKLGPMANYGWLPDAGKWCLSLCMLIGRLECFGVMILLHPLAWRR